MRSDGQATMFESKNSREPRTDNGPDDDPASAGSTHAMAGVTYVTWIAIFVLLVEFGWLFGVCNDFTIDWSEGNAVLTALHLPHVAIFALGCCTFSFDVLIVPLIFLLGGFAVAALDTFVLVQRGYIVFGGNSPQVGCEFFLFFFDAALWTLALSYCVYATVSLSRFGRFKVRTTKGPLLLVLVDVLLLFVLIAVLYLLCGAGALPPDNRISLLHLWHLTLIFSSCIVFQNDALLIPAWHIMIGIIAAALDGYVCYQLSIDFLDGVDDECDVFVWIIAFLFLLVSIIYTFVACSARARFGLCGDPDDVGDVFVDDDHRPDETRRFEGIADQSYVESMRSKARLLADAAHSGPAPLKRASKIV